MSDSRWLQLAGPVVEDGKSERRIPVHDRLYQDKTWAIVVGGSRTTSTHDPKPWGCVYLYIGPLTLYLSEAKAMAFDWEERSFGGVVQDYQWTD